MQVEFFPDLPQSPYQRLYAAAMAKHGITHKPCKLINDQVLEENRAHIDAIHFHWIEGLIGNGSTPARLYKIASFYRYLRQARRLGVRVIWTVHNHTRHDGYKAADQLGNLALCRQADLVITHSHWSAQWITRRYKPRGRVVVMPHGNFDGCYNPQQTPAQVRQQHNLKPDTPLIGMIGAVRPYRGHENAIRAIKQCLHGRVQLLIAGWEFSRAYGDSIKAMLGDLPDAAAWYGGISDDAYAQLVQACDLILLPYERITSSGAILSAWTLARPVVTNDGPFFQEMLANNPDAGTTARADQPNQLARGIERVLAIPKQQRESAARAQADRYTWDKVVEPVAQVVRGWQ